MQVKVADESQQNSKNSKIQKFQNNISVYYTQPEGFLHCVVSAHSLL